MSINDSVSGFSYAKTTHNQYVNLPMMNAMRLRRLIRYLKRSPFMEPVIALIDLVLFAVDRLACLCSPIPRSAPVSMLIIRLDVLGDYIAFRNYLRDLRQHPDYRAYQFVLLGNVAYRSLAEHFDRDVLDQCIWADFLKLSTNPVYRFRIVRQLRQHRYHIALSSTYSRIFVLDDLLIHASAAPVRIGCKTDFTNCKPWEAAIGNRTFTRLLDTGSIDEIVLEVERNRRIFSALLRADLPLQLPHFDATLLPKVALPTRYLILSPGAGFDDRIWPIERFAAVIEHLHHRHGITDVVVTGIASEQPYAQKLQPLLSASITLHNRIGAYNLGQLLAALGKADLLLANDSGTVPLAIAMQTPTVVVSQGKALLRWHPYPAAMNIPIVNVYPPFIEENRHQLATIAPDFQADSPLSILDINVAEVTRAASGLMNSRQQKTDSLNKVTGKLS